jgi:hypothetical protein
MGNQLSSTTQSSNILNKVLTDIIITNSINCEQNDINFQTINIGDITAENCNVEISHINQSIKLLRNINCASTSLSEIDLKNELKNKLNQKLKEEIGLAMGLFNVSDTNQLSEINNEIISKIDVKNTLNCISNKYNNQMINIENIQLTCRNGGSLKISDIQQSIISNTVSNCIQENETLNKLSTQLDNSATQELQKTMGATVSVISSIIIIIIFSISISLAFIE